MGKRLILLLTTVIMIMLLPFSGCSTDTVHTASGTAEASTSSGAAPESTAESVHTLRLPYDSTDSLNPYTVKTVANTALIPVLFDGLTRLNDKYEPEPVIAKEIKGGGVKWTAVLRTDLLFSDGSKLTADDVLYSYYQAKNSSGYRAQLENVASVSASENSIVFTLKSPDPLFANLLNFAIVKKDSAKGDAAIGSGRYFASVSGTSAKLIYNDRHFRKATPRQKEIPLISMPDHEAMLSGIKTGSLSAVFSDLSKGELSSAGALSESVNLSNFVYIGFHTGHEFVDILAVRQAIAAAIDRGTCFYKGFAGRGTQAALPIHPLIGAKMELSNNLLLQYDLKRANRLLDGAGFTQKDAGGYRLRDNQPITLTLLVNGESNNKKLTGTLIKEMLETVGIRAEIVQKPFAQYSADVKAGNYDLYLGEMKLLNNMSLTPLLNNPAVLAGPKNESLSAAYAAYLDGTGTYAAFIERFHEEMPMIPLLFRSGLLIYNRNIITDVRTSATDVYYNLEEWE